MPDVFANALNALQYGVLGLLLPFLVVLTIVVFFHELGHFLVARWAGVKVLTFSLGFGPEIVGFNDRHGTRWKISAIPLGGYVKFLGDESEASTPSAALDSLTPQEREQSFHHKKVGPRAAIVAAGPAANFILSTLIFALLFTFYGKPSTVARIDTIEAGSAAEKAGFKPNDLIVAINGTEIASFIDMQRIVSMSAGETLNIKVRRDEGFVNLTAVPDLKEDPDGFGGVQRIGRLGIKRVAVDGEKVTERVNFGEGLWLGARQCWIIVDTTFHFLGNVLAGKGGAEEISGPIGIARLSGHAASMGLHTLINLTAVLSVSIGLLNLFPVPLLDGGHLLFYAIEVVRGRPLSERMQELGFRIGFVMVMSLMLFALRNDLMKIAAIRNLFG